jgi:DNA-binding CsgD family transcriptional regulator
MHGQAIIKKFDNYLADYSCVVDEDDYAQFEASKRLLNRISDVENSSLAVYDLHRNQYLMYTSRFDDMFGCQLFNNQENIEDLFALMHPKDVPFVLDTVITALNFLDHVPASQKTDYKLILDFRLRNKKNNYVRFLQQMVALNLDQEGKLWLILKVIDLISTSEDRDFSIRKMMNMKTGELCFFNDTLDNASGKIISKREAEVLGLISQGLGSKEISERLFISVNTVNNHRQNILSKTNTENTSHALMYAKRIGII